MNTRVLRGLSPEFWSAAAEIYSEQDFGMYLPTPADIDYYGHAFAGTVFSDRAFAILLDGRPAALLIAAVGVGAGGDSELSLYGAPAVYLQAAGLSMADQRRIANALEEMTGIFEEIDTVFLRLPTTHMSALPALLLARGAEAALSFWRLLDLRSPPDELRAGVRKSYKNLINKGGDFEFRIFAEGCRAEDLDCFRLLHAQAAGRATRNAESWRMQLQKIQAGEAFLVIAFKHGAPVSGGYFLIDARTCYYGSAASPDKDDARGGAHALIWEAILFAKSRGCRHFDLGQILFPSQRCLLDIHARPVADDEHALPGERELGISRFKTGFGGATVPRLDILWKPAKSSKNTTGG